MEKKAKDKNILDTLIKKYMELNLSVRIISILVVVILILLAIVLNNEERKIKISAKSSLTKINEQTNLETVEYSYTSVAKKCIKKDCKGNKLSDHEYFVKYDGVVVAKIDFNKIKIEVDKNEKKVTVIIPEPKIDDKDYAIKDDKDALKFMFKSQKYNDADKLPEIRQACIEDMKNKVEKEPLILETAKKNAIEVINAFMEPWINVEYSEYKLEVK